MHLFHNFPPDYIAVPEKIQIFQAILHLKYRTKNGEKLDFLYNFYHPHLISACPLAKKASMFEPLFKKQLQTSANKNVV
jgi:hypothetical protein